MSRQNLPHRPALPALVTSSEPPSKSDQSPTQHGQTRHDDLSVQTPGEPQELIRVLDVHAGEEETVTCTLRIVSLASPEPYETLSYVWGNGPKCKTIHITNRNDIDVTQGLYDALVRLRYSSGSRMLWIDQCCIEQENAAEKTHQVRLMTKIYKLCTQCVIWFGEIPRPIREESAQGTFDMITLLAQSYWASSSPPSTPPPILAPPSVSTRALVDTAYDAFCVFIKNPWWRRIWTVQEAVLPPTLVLHWGPLSIPWSTVVAAARAGWFDWPSPIDSFDMQDFKPIVMGLDLTKEGETPLEILHRWRYRDALDARDKVYALGGLFDPEDTIPSIANCDYSVDVATLYANVTRDLIEWDQGLEYLVGMKMQRDPGLPSWAIDFRRCGTVNDGYAWWDPSFRYDWFDACAEVDLSEGMIRCDGRLLSLRGVKVGVVKRVGTARICDEVDDIEYEELVTQMRGWKNLLSECLSNEPADEMYPCKESEESEESEETYQEAFFRTVIGDLVTDEAPERRATDEDVQLVAEFAEEEDMDSEVVYSLRCMLMNHTFFMTSEGHMGIGPTDTKTGDEIWILAGGNVPFILRPTSVDEETHSPGSVHAGEHSLVGGAHLHGFMDGEAHELMSHELAEVHLH
ncbi:HET-domain-containing protein [Plenodomus tracheiphilus IPT5]|uniref:HET-domain-containing protein n=1 Tax=Plenodomus tracheiphilus IPT5 TaxID=1408161 RepID=A0A6A7AN66_9PLEO|nr:HET-domain-containing protein [Plenodomus tracheiphilus IPT5]